MLRRTTLLLFLAAVCVAVPLEAMAYRLWLETSYAGEALQAGQPLQVEVHLDTEGDTGAALFSVSVLYPEGVVSYDSGDSDYGYYPLYVPGGAKSPAQVWNAFGPDAPANPAPWPANDGQVNIDYVLDPFAQSGSTSTSSDELLATLVFRGAGMGSGAIELSTSSGGNVFMLAGSPPVDAAGSVTLGAPVAVNAAAVPVLGGFGAIVLAGVLATSGRRRATATRIASLLVALLFAGLAVTVAGQVEAVTDTDGDGVPDPLDNCVLVSNGPLSSNGVCSVQQDTDQDGYGDRCDADFNNDGAVGLDDWATFLQYMGGAYDPAFDFNCDGLSAGIDDGNYVFSQAAAYALPGPSGLACAGTVPCP